jgi:hypothetical protein
MKVEVKLDAAAIKKIQEAAKAAAAESLEAVLFDLKESKTMPFDTGELQEKQTFVDNTKDGARLVSGIIYSRYLYYGLHMVDSETLKGPHPIKDLNGAVKGFRYHSGAHLIPDPSGKQLNYRQGGNHSAGSHWLEPYISGDKKDFVRDEFAKALEKRLGSK